MKALVAAIAVGCLFLPVAATAQTCPDSTPPAIQVPTTKSALKCLSAITKASGKFVKAKTKVLGKCESKRSLGLCPQAKDTEKIEKAANKGALKVAKLCGSPELAALPGTSYSSGFSAADVTSCMLSQNNVEAQLIVNKLNGIAPGKAGNVGDDGEKCMKTLNKQSSKLIPAVLNTINKCVIKQGKDGATGDVSTVCAPSYSGGSYVAPTDTKTAQKIQKFIDKFTADVDANCPAATGEGSSGFISKLFACPGATTVDELKECFLCTGPNNAWTEVNSILQQQYGETGTLVTNGGPGSGSLQAAIDAASPGDKLLIQSGTYDEHVEISTADLKLVGCGGATNDRPRITPAAGATGLDRVRGVQATDVDGLYFQSLDFFDWDEDGIFVSGQLGSPISGVTFRDITGDGNINSRYIIFPQFADNVLIEGSRVWNCDDAAVYAGKDTNVVIRYNESFENVAGIEVENCEFATVHNNYSHDNSGGMLVFEDPSITPQVNNNHDVFNNVVSENNTPNFAPSGFVQNIIRGTGLLLIVTDDSEYHHNIVLNNDTLGLVLIDHEGVNILTGGPTFFPKSVDPTNNDNFIHDNANVNNNGGNPDAALGFGVKGAAAYGEDNTASGLHNTGNCFQNTGNIVFLLGGANDCP